ncbi:unnamed protein product, partial [Brenthis ino]
MVAVALSPRRANLYYGSVFKESFSRHCRAGGRRGHVHGVNTSTIRLISKQSSIYKEAARTRRETVAGYGRCERLLATDSLPEVAFGGMTSITIRNVVPHRGVSASESVA